MVDAPKLIQHDNSHHGEIADCFLGGLVLIFKQIAETQPSMMERQQAYPKEGPVSWVAGPFGDCIRACPGSRHCKMLSMNVTPVKCKVVLSKDHGKIPNRMVILVDYG